MATRAVQHDRLPACLRELRMSDTDREVWGDEEELDAIFPPVADPSPSVVPESAVADWEDQA